MYNRRLARILVVLLCISILSSAAYAASWTKDTRGGHGTLAAGTPVLTYHYVKTTADNRAATLKHVEITTDVTYWFGLRDKDNNKVHQSTSRRNNQNNTYQHLINEAGLSDTVKYKSAKGAKGSSYALAVQTDSNTAREAFYKVKDFYS